MVSVAQVVAPCRRCRARTNDRKRRLGLIGAGMPEHIEIDGSDVQGVVVVGGYTRETEAHAENLRASHPELDVRIFRNRLFD